MKTTHKKKKKASSAAKPHRAHTKSEPQHNAFEKLNTDMKTWGSSVSHRFLSNYAIPFTRLVEAKLISLQTRV